MEQFDEDYVRYSDDDDDEMDGDDENDDDDDDAGSVHPTLYIPNDRSVSEWAKFEESLYYYNARQNDHDHPEKVIRSVVNESAWVNVFNPMHFVESKYEVKRTINMEFKRDPYYQCAYVQSQKEGPTDYANHVWLMAIEDGLNNGKPLFSAENEYFVHLLVMESADRDEVGDEEHFRAKRSCHKELQRQVQLNRYHDRKYQEFRKWNKGKIYDGTDAGLAVEDIQEVD